MKTIGFLSFGAWHPDGGLTHSGGEALHQRVELAVGGGGDADTLLLTVSSQLGVEHNAAMLGTIAREITPRSTGAR